MFPQVSPQMNDEVETFLNWHIQYSVFGFAHQSASFIAWMEPGSSCPVKAAGGGKQSVHETTATLANANEASHSVAAVEKA